MGDFQAKLDKLTQQLNTDETDQTNLKQAIDSVKEAVSKISDVDFTVYAHKTDLENYYTKAETDAKLAEAGKVKAVNNVAPDSAGNINIDLSGLETKTDAKSANDAINKKISDNATAIKKNSDDIATKANSTDVYTKTELDPKIAEAGKVKTVNNVQPDSSGNINIDLSGLETKADAKKALDTKSEEITALRTENNNLKQEVDNLKNKNAELEQEIKDSEIPTFNTLSEYQLWAKDHPNRLAYVLDDTQ